jgi:hypothetical protein
MVDSMMAGLPDRDAPLRAPRPDEPHSFFRDSRGQWSATLRPTIWIQNMPVLLVPELEPLNQPDIHRDGVNDALVQRAKNVWRKSKGQPGSGNTMFFNLALSLRRAGMNLQEIEGALRREAQWGRSPKERLAQIPSVIANLRRYSGLVS